MRETHLILEAFGWSLREHRTESRLTQRNLAARMRAKGHNWHTSTVSKPERGNRDPSLVELVSLATILEATISVITQVNGLS